MRALGWLAIVAVSGLLLSAQDSSSAGGAPGAGNSPSTSAGDPASEGPVPRAFYTGEGQFEIVVREAGDAQQALALGRSVWNTLSVPVGLPPAGFPQPVSVRLVPSEQWTEPVAFTVTIETPGRVTVRLRWSKAADPVVVRRAFVQGLLLRQAAAWHGVSASLTVPLWLEQACTGLSLVRERPSLMDLYQQESAGLAVAPPLRSLLMWERGTVESRGWELASLWLLLQLQTEAGGDASRWGGWLRGVLGGGDPMETLPRSYPGLWADWAAMDLWWQVGFHHQRRLTTLPMMSAEASRAWLGDRSRWLAGRGGREIVLPLAELHEIRGEPWVRTELTERIGHLQAILGAIHPYYTNAAISLGRVYEAAFKGNLKHFEAALVEFERDAIDGRELEDTVNAILNTAPKK